AAPSWSSASRCRRSGGTAAEDRSADTSPVQAWGSPYTRRRVRSLAGHLAVNPPPGPGPHTVHIRWAAVKRLGPGRATRPTTFPETARASHSDGITPGDPEGLPGDEARIVGAEEQRRGHDVVGRAVAMHQLEARRRVEKRLREIGVRVLCP